MRQVFEGHVPDTEKALFVAENATLVGQVYLGEECSVWYGAVLRADTQPITIGAQSNVQDGAVLHTSPVNPVTLGRGVTVGHGAVVHGCTVGDYVLVGMNATILNRAQIGEHCIIAAGALVPEDMVVPAGSLVMGVPGRVVRPLTEKQRAYVEQNAQAYVGYAKRYAAL